MRNRSCSFDLLEPRLFLSTTMFREGGGVGFVDTRFDDAQITSATDVPNGTSAAGIAVGGSPTNYGLLGINDLFALLPKNAAGQVINVSQAKLHLFRADAGVSAGTISVFSAATDWMTGAAGTNETDVTFQHSDKGADVAWAAGNFGIGDYSAGGATAGFASGIDQEIVIDITSLVAAMYQSGTNDGFVISASDAISYRTAENAIRGLRPVLEITYTYVDATHPLTVNSGSGDGDYAPGALVGVT
ncbi:MAG: DNRLRE domain-containing protein, partial [Planctomycetaceae bacterium]